MKQLAATVLLTVYNGEGYLRQAIQSILDQTFSDFEFIIINDGSTDSSDKIVESFSDRRIRYISQKNHGLVYSLNKGIELANAPLIARMDADDISLPNRLAEQVAFMNDHPDHVLVGSNLEFVNEEGVHVLSSPLLLNDSELRLEMLLRSPFGHPSVMYRKQAVIDAGLYDPDYKSAEDYDLWIRMMKLGKLANINQTLHQYRIFKDDASTTNKSEQKINTAAIRDAFWKSELPKVPRFSSIAKPYAAADQTTKIQLGRLADAYVGIFSQALRRGKIGYSIKVAWCLCGLTGLWQVIKSLKRKLWSRA